MSDSLGHLAVEGQGQKKIRDNDTINFQANIIYAKNGVFTLSYKMKHAIISPTSNNDEPMPIETCSYMNFRQDLSGQKRPYFADFKKKL